MATITFTLKDLIEDGIEKNKEIILKHFQKDHSLFLEAIRVNSLELVKLLIENGADVKGKNNQAIQLASQCGYLEIVKLLIEHGADVKAETNLAIRCASQNGHLEVVKLLIEHGADVKADNNNPIRYASLYGRLEVVKLLLAPEYGVNVKAQDNQAIIWASQNGHLEVVKLLIEHGADVKAQNNLAIRYTSRNGHLKVVKVLIEHGATLSQEYFNDAKNNVKKYLLALKNIVYYGIVSKSKLDIKLPELQEIIKNDKYYYVYKCKGTSNPEIEGYKITDQINRHNILSQFGEVSIFTTL